MKMIEKEATPPAPQQPVFHKIAENLYRLESSGGYYALVKKGGKQFRCSLKAKDRKLADRRLKDINVQVGSLAMSDDAKLDFEAVANRWLDSIKHTLAPSTLRPREIHIKNVGPYFKGMPVRNTSCSAWSFRRGAEIFRKQWPAYGPMLSGVRLRLSAARRTVSATRTQSFIRVGTVRRSLLKSASSCAITWRCCCARRLPERSVQAFLRLWRVPPKRNGSSETSRP